MISNKSKSKVTARSARSFRSRVHYNPSPDFGESRKTPQNNSNASKPLVPSTQKKWPAWKPIPSLISVVESSTGDHKPQETEQRQVNVGEKITVLKKDPVQMPKFEKERASRPAQQIDEVILTAKFKEQRLEENFMKLPNVNAGDPWELFWTSPVDWPLLSTELHQLSKTSSLLGEFASEALAKFYVSCTEPPAASYLSMPPPALQFVENFLAPPTQTAAAMEQQSNVMTSNLESQEALLRSILGLQPKSSGHVESLDFSRLKQAWQLPQQHGSNFSKEDFPALPQAASKLETAKTEQTAPPTIGRKPAGITNHAAEMGYLDKVCANLMNNTTQFYNNPTNTSQLINSTINPTNRMQFNNHSNVINPPNMMQDHEYGLSGLIAFAHKNLQVSETDLQSSAHQKPVCETLPSFSDATSAGSNILQQLPVVPKEYYFTSQVREKLNTPQFNNLSEDLLFKVFYHFTGDELGILAAQELFARNWRFHKEKRCWMTPHPRVGTQRVGEYEYGVYNFFDPVTWKLLTNEACIRFSDLEIVPRVVLPVPPDQAFPAAAFL